MNASTQYIDHLPKIIRVALWVLLVLSLTSLHHPGFAQKKEHPILQTTRAETDSSRGYWRLKTLVETRMTVIQFFAPGEQLIYQESLPEKWVKPTQHNRRQFDRLLKELMGHQLVTTRIKTQTHPTLLPTRDQPDLGPNPAADKGGRVYPSETPYTLHAFVNQAGKLRLLVDNPLRLRYKIELVDERGNLHYQEFTNIEQYRRYLDISSMDAGRHKLTVRIDGREIQYDLNNRQVKRVYQLVPLAVN